MSAEIRRHWDLVARLGCLISGREATLHHVHGGSCKTIGIHKGMGQKTNDWLVIPIAAEYHHMPPLGIDSGGMSVVEWETMFGTQVSMLETVSSRLGYDVIARAGLR